MSLFPDTLVSTNPLPKAMYRQELLEFLHSNYPSVFRNIDGLLINHRGTFIEVTTTNEQTRLSLINNGVEIQNETIYFRPYNGGWLSLRNVPLQAKVNDILQFVKEVGGGITTVNPTSRVTRFSQYHKGKSFKTDSVSVLLDDWKPNFPSKKFHTMYGGRMVAFYYGHRKPSSPDPVRVPGADVPASKSSSRGWEQKPAEQRPDGPPVKPKKKSGREPENVPKATNVRSQKTAKTDVISSSSSNTVDTPTEQEESVAKRISSGTHINPPKGGKKVDDSPKSLVKEQTRQISHTKAPTPQTPEEKQSSKTTVSRRERKTSDHKPRFTFEVSNLPSHWSSSRVLSYFSKVKIDHIWPQSSFNRWPIDLVAADDPTNVRELLKHRGAKCDNNTKPLEIRFTSGWKEPKVEDQAVRDHFNDLEIRYLSSMKRSELNKLPKFFIRVPHEITLTELSEALHENSFTQFTQVRWLAKQPRHLDDGSRIACFETPSEYVPDCLKLKELTVNGTRLPIMRKVPQYESVPKTADRKVVQAGDNMLIMCQSTSEGQLQDRASLQNHGPSPGVDLVALMESSPQAQFSFKNASLMGPPPAPPLPPPLQYPSMDIDMEIEKGSALAAVHVSSLQHQAPSSSVTEVVLPAGLPTVTGPENSPQPQDGETCIVHQEHLSTSSTITMPSTPSSPVLPCVEEKVEQSPSFGNDPQKRDQILGGNEDVEASLVSETTHIPSSVGSPNAEVGDLDVPASDSILPGCSRPILVHSTPSPQSQLPSLTVVDEGIQGHPGTENDQPEGPPLSTPVEVINKSLLDGFPDVNLGDDAGSNEFSAEQKEDTPQSSDATLVPLEPSPAHSLASCPQHESSRVEFIEEGIQHHRCATQDTDDAARSPSQSILADATAASISSTPAEPHEDISMSGPNVVQDDLGVHVPETTVTSVSDITAHSITYPESNAPGAAQLENDSSTVAIVTKSTQAVIPGPVIHLDERDELEDQSASANITTASQPNVVPVDDGTQAPTDLGLVDQVAPPTSPPLSVPSSDVQPEPTESVPICSFPESSSQAVILDDALSLHPDDMDLFVGTDQEECSDQAKGYLSRRERKLMKRKKKSGASSDEPFKPKKERDEEDLDTHERPCAKSKKSKKKKSKESPKGNTEADTTVPVTENDRNSTEPIKSHPAQNKSPATSKGYSQPVVYVGSKQMAFATNQLDVQTLISKKMSGERISTSDLLQIILNQKCNQERIGDPSSCDPKNWLQLVAFLLLTHVDESQSFTACNDWPAAINLPPRAVRTEWHRLCGYTNRGFLVSKFESNLQKLTNQTGSQVRFEMSSGNSKKNLKHCS